MFCLSAERGKIYTVVTDGLCFPMVCCTFLTGHWVCSEICIWNLFGNYFNFAVCSCKVSCAEWKEKQFWLPSWNVMKVWEWDPSEFEVTIKLTALMSLQSAVNSFNSWDRSSSAQWMLCYCSLRVASAVILSDVLFWGIFPSKMNILVWDKAKKANLTLKRIY